MLKRRFASLWGRWERPVGWCWSRGLSPPGRGFWGGCAAVGVTSRTWKLVGGLVAISVVSFLLGYLFVLRVIA